LTTPKQTLENPTYKSSKNIKNIISPKEIFCLPVLLCSSITYFTDCSST